MTLISWSPAYSVNIKDLDSQHKNLFELIDQLAIAMKQGKSKEIMAEIIESLTNYTVTHFNAEENYFKQFNYPDYKSHKKEHDNFIIKVSQFKTGVDAGQHFLAVEVQQFLLDWLSVHIRNSDKKYTAFLNSKGIR